MLRVVKNNTDQQRVAIEDRPLPANIDAERAVLGACLLDRDVIVVISNVLDADMFYLYKHEIIFQAISACYMVGTPPDVSTVADELRRIGKLDEIGGILYLGELSADVPTAVHAEYYARIVETTATRRKLIETGGQIAALGYDESTTLPETLTEAQALLTQASNRPGENDAFALSGYVDHWLDRFNGPPEGTPSGFAEYDRLTGGFHASDLVVLAGRPGTGKTALGLQIAYNIAQAGGHVLFFSMEMGRDQLMNRLVAMVGGLDVQQLMRCQVAGARKDDFDDAVRKVRRVAERIHIQEQSSIDAATIRWETLRFRHQHGTPALVVVDYLQKVRGEAKLRDQMFLSVGQVAVDLKSLAKEAQCPVLAISSVNRENMNTRDKKLELHHLGSSGQIEYEADQVLLLNKGEENEVIVGLAKHRNGPQGTVPLLFHGSTASFTARTWSSPEGY